jgi:hypothetical protein
MLTLGLLSAFSHLFSVCQIVRLIRILRNAFIYIPSLFSSNVHPNQCPGPETHRNADGDHGIHTPGEVRREVGPIEDDAPPSIDRVTPHVHACYDNGPETVFLVAEYVVCPREKRGLTSIHTTSPVVHSKVNCGTVRVCQDQRTGNDTGHRNPVAH